MTDPLFVYGFPLGALALGAIAFTIAWVQSRSFDRHYRQSHGLAAKRRRADVA